MSHPPDTIVSYMNKAKGSTFTSSAKALGLRGLWGGLVARTIMIGTLTAMQWFIYDFVKVIYQFDLAHHSLLKTPAVWPCKNRDLNTGNLNIRIT